MHMFTFKCLYLMVTICHCGLTLFWRRYVRSLIVSGPAGSPLRALQAASRAVSPLGLRPFTSAPPSTSRRTRRSFPEDAALMSGLQSDRGSNITTVGHSVIYHSDTNNIISYIWMQKCLNPVIRALIGLLWHAHALYCQKYSLIRPNNWIQVFQ